MSDELTPEEKEAIDRLPRERMPAGLEARVVGAMRERGYLARQRRTIVLTGGRAAGLFAACVALMIGAYSIGLHRGDANQVRTVVLPATESPKPDGSGRTNQPRAAFEREAEPSSPEGTLEKDGAFADEQKASGRIAEPKRAPVAESARAESPAPAAGLAESAQLQESAAPEAREIPLTFILNGTPLIVEAPDSVRVTRDERGNMLLIYTSDGIIRIRMAGER